ncbi:hypothetical protein BX600DRAFT_512335 [Xylariales sp. PMI_506]|nr:hypothetical protein BX600DRAFT_512335 [Xylariales sp. PMI_506]
MQRILSTSARLCAPRLVRSPLLATTSTRAGGRRLYSSEAPSTSQHANFYKTFGRPILKVALMAVFTYQLAYYGWVKLETDETRDELAAEITQLETRVAELEASRAAAAKK